MESVFPGGKLGGTPPARIPELQVKCFKSIQNKTKTPQKPQITSSYYFTYFTSLEQNSGFSEMYV